jgi:hypothetical protein
MANIRILYENQAKRANSLTASSEAGSNVAANLLDDIKTTIHRSTGTSATYALTWSAPVAFNMVALAFTNWTSMATIRARVYTLETDPNPAVDSGVVNACAYAPLGQFTWGLQPLGVNAFRFGGGSYGRVYFPSTSGRKLVIDIDDATNPAGFIEQGCLITGHYWEPECNPAWGAEIGMKYSGQHEESDAGDIRTERRAKRRVLDLQMDWIKTPTDQLAMHEIMMQGLDAPLFISLFPEDANPVLEQRYQMYCKLKGDTSMAHPKYGLFAVPLSVLEI